MELTRRSLLGTLLSATACLGGGAAFAASSRYDAVVAKPGARAPVGRRFDTLFAALSRSPRGALRVWVGVGEWREKLVIDRPDVTIVGENRSASVLVFDAAAGTRRPDGSPWGTTGSATLSVLAPGFTAQNLTIANDYRPPDTALPGEGPLGAQAVALLLAQRSDRAILRHVDVIGRQDTLFVDAGRAAFEECLIAGTVDFVFGAGAALFRECEIRSRVRTEGGTSGGFVAAPSTPAGQAVGMVFDRCRLTREDGVADRVVFLGRPWRPTRSFPDGRYGDPQAVAMAAFLDCRMEGHIAAPGWTAMSNNGADGHRRELQPEAVRFGERGSSGPGSTGARRGRSIDAAMAAKLRHAFDGLIDAGPR